MQVRALLIRSRQQVLGHLEVLLPALFDALSGPSDRVVLEALSYRSAFQLNKDSDQAMVCHSDISVVKPQSAVLQASICRAYLQAAGGCVHGQTGVEEEDSGAVTNCILM